MKFKDFEYEVKYGLVKIISYTGNVSKLKIPSKIGKYPVYSICTRAFLGLDTLEEVVIPSSVGKIEDGAFTCCPNLKRIEMGLVEEINKPFNTFSDDLVVITSSLETADKFVDNEYNFAISCKKDFKIKVLDKTKKECMITKVNKYRTGYIYLPDEINGYKVVEFGFNLSKLQDPDEILFKKARLPKHLRVIPNVFFDHQEELEEVIFGDEIVEVGSDAFRNCKSLKILDLPSSVRKIGLRAFARMPLEKITIPEGMEQLEMLLFAECKNLREVTLPKSLKEIDSFAFTNCRNLTRISIPEDVTDIGVNTFSGCVKLEEVKLSNVKTLRQSTFSTCKSLKKIEIPKSVRTIEQNAFEYCSNLEEVTASDETTICDEAFHGCYNLKSISSKSP